MAITTNVPSDNFEDLQRDVQDATQFTNATTPFLNRVGTQIKPIKMIESEAISRLQGIGFLFLDPLSFTTGATLTNSMHALRRSDGEYFRWSGALPKNVAPGTDPLSDINFVAIGSASFAQKLADPDSEQIIAGVPAKDLALSSTSDVARKAFGGMVSYEYFDGNAGLADNTPVLVTVDRSVYLPEGEFELTTKWNFNRSNIIIRGSGIDSTIIFSNNLLSLMEFAADCSNVTFKDLTFECRTVNAIGDFYGIIKSQDKNLKNIRFEKVKFKCPAANINAIKIINESTQVVSGFEFIRCIFDNIGKMAIEFQNHTADTVSRYAGVVVDLCEFANIGVLGEYGMAVSLSGYGQNCKLTRNTMDNCFGVALELVGPSVVDIHDNTFKNMDRACDIIGITGNRPMSKISVKGNKTVGDTFTNGEVKMWNCSDSIFAENKLKIWQLNFRDINRLDFSCNHIYTNGNYGLYVEGNSKLNRFRDSYLDTLSITTKFNDMRFSGVNTTNNIIEDFIIARSSVGTICDNINSATNNFAMNLFNNTGQRLRHWQVIAIPDANYDFSAEVAVRDAIELSGTLTSERTLTLYKLPQPLSIWNRTGQTLNVTCTGGSITEPILNNERKTAYYDGNNIRIF